MASQALIGFIGYAIVNAFTPGPGNFLALNVATIYGWSRGKPLFFGIFAGYYAVQTLCGLFVFGIGALVPQILVLLKYAGAIYIVWLMIHIATSKPQSATAGETASFARGFLLQFANAKIYLFGITALTGFVTPHVSGLPAIMGAQLCIATIGTIATLTWIAAGIAIQEVYRTWYRPINIALAATLGLSLCSMLAA